MQPTSTFRNPTCPAATAAIYLQAAARCRRVAAEHDGTYEGDAAWRLYWLGAAREHIAAAASVRAQ